MVFEDKVLGGLFKNKRSSCEKTVEKMEFLTNENKNLVGEMISLTKQVGKPYKTYPSCHR